MNPAPILRLVGRLHTDLVEREVPAYEGREAYRDDNGTYHRAVDPRPAYSIFETNVVTDGGGFISLSARSEVVEQATAAGWSLPGKGEDVDLPVRPYLMWTGPDGRRFQTIRLALSDTLCDELKAAKPGARSLAATGS